jgi:hypothetical protein
MPVRPRAGRVEPPEVIAGREDQSLEVLFAKYRLIGQPSPQLLSERLADDVIEELVLVGEVRVKSGPVYGRPTGDLPHGESGMTLLRHELVERPHDELAGTPDAGIYPLRTPSREYSLIDIFAPLLLCRHGAVLDG